MSWQGDAEERSYAPGGIADFRKIGIVEGKREDAAFTAAE